MSGVSGQSTDNILRQPLLTGPRSTTSVTSTYPSADAYFMERVYRFMRTAILVCSTLLCKHLRTNIVSVHQLTL